MLLRDYISNIDKKYQNLFFSGVSFDSSKVKKNYIFFAIRGNNYDGNDFIPQAIKNGAKIIVSQKKLRLQKNVTFLRCSNVRKLLAEVSYKIFNKRPEKLIAVTGTNGKSSIADFYFQILNLNKKKVVSIGTIGVRDQNKRKNITNTTLDPIQLGRALFNLKKKKIKYVIMEASSHGLDQNRLDGLLFDIGIFTNLSHDHLDYHKNMKNYFSSKLYLFKKLIRKKGNIITDANISQAKVIENVAKKRKISFNPIFDKRGINLISHRFANEKQILKIKFLDKEYDFRLNLVGKLQVKNILMAVLAAEKSGIKFDKIIENLQKIKPVEGRLEKIGKIKNNSRVILDYAHTPAALELALSNLRDQFPNSKLKVIFGCGGNRDLKKRSVMGSIAEKYSNNIYLTDDNPRNENPSKIRNDIKKGIKKAKIREIPNRRKAISEAIKSLKTGDLLLVAGKGHEKIQDYGKRKLFFSDKEIILKSITIKNKSLSKNLKLNIIREESSYKIANKTKIKNISINSKTIKKNDVFFAIKGKKNDGNKFLSEVFKKKPSLTIVEKRDKNFSFSKQLKVTDTLNFLTRCSTIFRENINTKIISITGSCGKTTLKEMIGTTLKSISRTTFSPKSFNNKYGVPLSLFNLKSKDEFGVLEVGMDKKGEINNLSKIIKPDLGIITNISYAHSKNFKNIKDIADAKAEIMNNIKKGGTIILNNDDNFYEYHKKIALLKNLKVISFSIHNRSASVKLMNIKRIKKIYDLSIDINGKLLSFFAQNDNKSNIYNILATLASIDELSDIQYLKKDIFLNFKIPNGRGDLSLIKLNNKKFFLIDETYNSNPLSLKTAIENYNKIISKNSKKYLLLGDMLELGKHSSKQHSLITNILNKTKIHKVYVMGKFIKVTFKGLKENKKGKILINRDDIFRTLKKNLNNNDYLMIKGSNATGLHKIATNLKQRKSHAF